MLGYDERVETICDGGFALDVRFAPTRLRELSKMDGAVILSTDGNRIVRANVQLVPDPTIPTDESGTRHRSAERAAIQTGYPVISVSHSMNIVTVYVAGERHVVADSATIMSRANQAIATLERYKARLDEVSRQLSTAEIEDFVTLRDVMTVVQRLEMVRRIGLEIDYDAVELGTDGRQLRLQLEELLGGNDTARELIERQKVRMKYFDVIYHLTEDVAKEMAGIWGPERIENVVGRAEVKEVFPAGKRDKAAGLLVLEGGIRKGLFARLTRQDVIVSKTVIASLRRFKDDVPEVRAGLECGVVLQDTNDIKPGDMLEVFEVEERERTL